MKTNDLKQKLTMKRFILLFTLLYLFVFYSANPFAQSRGHKGDIYDFAVSDDGKFLVSSSTDPKLVLWDLNSGLILDEWDEAIHPISKVEIKNGKIAYIKFNSKKLYIVFVGRTQQKKEVLLNSQPIRIAISRDGKLIAVGHKNGFVKVLDFVTFKLIKDHRLFKKSIVNLLFSADSKSIIASDSSKQGRIKIFEVTTGEVLNSWKAHGSRVRSINISDDGKMLITGSYDMTVKVWDSNDNKLLKEFTNKSEKYRIVKFSNDSQIIASYSAGKRLALWNFKSGNQIFDRKLDNRLNDFEFLSNGKSLVSLTNKSISILDTRTGAVSYQLGKSQISVEIIDKIKEENRFKDYTIHSFCELNINGNNIPDHSIVLFNNNRAFYVVSIDRQLEVITHASLSGPKTSCFKNDKVRKYSESFKTTEGINGNIKLINDNDTVCTFIDETESKCWQYDSNSKKMVHTGGWRLD